jgi:hypothetical protein
MAAPFNLIQRGALQERLSRGLGIKERSPAPQLDSVVTPVVILDDLTRQSEFIAPTERRCVIGHRQVAVVGEFGCWAFSNPSNSGVVAVFDHLLVSTGTVDRFRWGRGQTTGLSLAGVGDPSFADRRISGVPVVQLFAGTNGVTNVLQAYGDVENNFVYELGPGTRLVYVLAPGDVLSVELTNLNIAGSITAGWYELVQQ